MKKPALVRRGQAKLQKLIIQHILHLSQPLRKIKPHLSACCSVCTPT